MTNKNTQDKNTLLKNPIISRRKFLQYMTAAGLGLNFLASGAGCTLKGSFRRETLNFYNYSNYIGRETIPRFEKKYNIRVNSDYYSKQEILFAKIRMGVTGYDLIVATDNMIPRFLNQELLVPLQKDSIPNLKNLMEYFESPPFDPQHDFTIPYLWGTTVIAYNKNFVTEIPNSWRALWNPDYKGRITMLDEKRESIGAALIMLGYSSSTKNLNELEEAKKVLLEQRPLLKKYTSDSYIDELISNDIWIAQAWSGDVIQVIRENPDVDFLVPQEGSLVWVDNCCIPQGAPHIDAANKFINYILEPDVGAELASHVGYATPNEAAFEILKKTNPEQAQDTRIYPSEEIKNRLQYNQYLGDFEVHYNSVWEDVKLGIT